MLLPHCLVFLPRSQLLTPPSPLRSVMMGLRSDCQGFSIYRVPDGNCINCQLASARSSLLPKSLELLRCLWCCLLLRCCLLGASRRTAAAAARVTGASGRASGQQG